ncbi:MAG: NAD(P)-dependent oxidoreductase [Betaproteobacteria bacterium]|nr:NAD(P)-dependent oxidoreductase [Betaproteobacteria bacterium]
MTDKLRKAIGVVGLGLLGRAIAARLAAAGFEVIGYDRSPEAMRSLDGRAGEEALRAPRIVLAVFDSADAEQVVGASSAGLYVDCTTGDPARVEALASRLAMAGVRYIEAPLSGSSDAVRRGEALMLVGGDPTGCEDLLAGISTQRVVVGAAGMAARAKLATNLVLGLNRAAIAEGMAFAESLGIPRGQFLDLVRASPAASAAALAKGEKMVSGDYAPESRIRQHLKDVRTMLAASPLELPLTRAHERLLDDAVAAGDGDLDNAAIIRRWQAGNG